MAKKQTELNQEMREKYIALVSNYLSSVDEEVLRTGTNKIDLPVVDSEGGEAYMQITFVVKKGSRDGEEYDGYQVAEDFAFEQKVKADKAKARAEKAKKKG